MDHGLEIERRVTKDLLRLAADLNAPLLATNDSHYVKPTDREVQDAHAVHQLWLSAFRPGSL